MEKYKKKCSALYVSDVSISPQKNPLATKERRRYTNCANSSEESELDPVPDAHPAQPIQLTQFQRQQQHPFTNRLR